MEQSGQPDQQQPVAGPPATPEPGGGEEPTPKLSPTPPLLQDLSREYLNVRVLDPLSAYRIKGQGDLQATAFLADTLLVRGRHPEMVEALREAADEAGFRLEPDPMDADADDDLLRRAREK